MKGDAGQQFDHVFGSQEQRSAPGALLDDPSDFALVDCSIPNGAQSGTGLAYLNRLHVLSRTSGTTGTSRWVTNTSPEQHRAGDARPVFNAQVVGMTGPVELAAVPDAP
jgi:hypothetical protein